MLDGKKVLAFGDGYSTLVGQPLTVAAPGPLENDATGGSATTMVIDNEPEFDSTHGGTSGALVPTIVYRATIDLCPEHRAQVEAQVGAT